MKKRIISFVLLCMIAISCFTVSAFALSDEQKGENYDSSHADNNCCCGGFDTDGLPNDDLHYDYGYEDGLIDGFNAGYEMGQNLPNQEAIDSSIAEYKNSQEYKDFMNEQYKNGLEAGYNNASAELDEKAEQMYQIGLQDGYVEYQLSDEYKQLTSDIHQSAYEKGYLEGHEDGLNVDLSNIKSVEPGTLFALFGAFITLIILMFVITYFTRKKGKKK